MEAFTSRQWKLLVDASPDAIVVVDADGHIVYTSSMASRLFGYDADELVGHAIEMLVPERIRDQHRHDRDAYLLDPLARTMGERPTLKGQRKDGSRFPAHINLSPVDIGGRQYVAAAVRDVRDLEEARQEIARQRHNLRELIDHMPDAVAVHRDGKLVYANSALAQTLGYRRVDELIGRPILELTHEEQHDEIKQQLSHMKTSGASAPPAEVRFYRRDGTLVTAEMHLRPMLFDGEPAFVAIGRDVKHKHEQLARVMRQDRKTAVGTLASGVAHEVNNPLGFTKSSVEFVLGELAAGAESLDDDKIAQLVDALSDAREGLDRIAGIVSDLDTFVDYRGRQMELVSLTDVIEAAISLVFGRLDTSAHLVRSLREVPPVRAKRAQLAEVFVNLLTNAILAIEECPGELDELRVSVDCIDDRVHVEITDTGCGIAAETLPHVFDPFFSTRSQDKGTGLGLTTAQNVIEKLGGAIDVDSQHGEGTTVTLWLPASEPCGPAELAGDTEALSYDSTAPTRELDSSH